ncbi:hypothetical protein TWF694_009099 [Orbilia ellipsospora]|uniref:Peptidase S8/S53 domain-containing protein n=1 Tax=Orbilia ellipsospora TaxID=2528407 RepID=A0AAV9XDV9_9PEZI
MKHSTILSTSLILFAIKSTALTVPQHRLNIPSRPYNSFNPSTPEHKKIDIAPPSLEDDEYEYTESSKLKHPYTIILQESESRPWNSILRDFGFKIKKSSKTHKYGMMSYSYDDRDIRTFGHTIRAFTILMTEREAKLMLGNPAIANLEKTAKREYAVMPHNPLDQPKHLPVDTKDSEKRINFDIMKRDDRPYFHDVSDNAVWISQANAPWHLQRVSCSLQVDLRGRAPTDLSYNYRYEQLAGQGVDVYVVDSGINVDHVDFDGRAQMIFSYFGKSEDDVGHGTHTAGTIGSVHYGVAKNVNIFGIKVGNSEGINGAAIVAGIDAAITNHNKRKNLPGFMGSIISMSIGTSPPAQSDYLALKRALDAGMHASVAAMNSNADACESSPGAFSRELPLINVGALDLKDARAEFSNYGKCVDVYAPGVSIVSTFNGNSTAIMSMDGTSMACPIVTGIIADELVKHPDLKLDPKAMKAHILEKALKGVIKASLNMTGTEGLVNNGFRSEPRPKPADAKAFLWES